MNEQNLKAFYKKFGFLPDSQGIIEDGPIDTSTLVFNDASSSGNSQKSAEYYALSQHKKRYPYKMIITTATNTNEYLSNIDCQSGTQKFAANKGIERPKLYLTNEEDCKMVKKKMVDDGIPEDDILYGERDLPKNSPFAGCGLPTDINLSEIFCIYRIPKQ